MPDILIVNKCRNVMHMRQLPTENVDILFQFHVAVTKSEMARVHRCNVGKSQSGRHVSIVGVECFA